ncbi:hypothetical protein BDN72DRAFT_841549 [Pluteus cervinus]|uniref:Uncharacterized protein n=1 Tax=Pluteus cervinus TaxID=181527 RepID=A0ACD3AS83_9AGAR|nr:hypothetical protein BDN72DRAFT_841549 [Pluteus cervinus]
MLWALHERAFLSWHSCIRVRNASTVSDSTNSELAVKAWIESGNRQTQLSRCEVVYVTGQGISIQAARGCAFPTSFNVNAIFPWFPGMSAGCPTEPKLSTGVNHPWGFFFES